MRVVGVYSIKGGVGKTATAVNLAFLSAQAGARTLLWDLDPQAASTFYFRVKPKVRGGIRKWLRRERPLDRLIRGTDYGGLDLLPADFSYRRLDVELERKQRPRKRLREKLLPLGGEYDHVYIDCAPGMSIVTEGVFVAVDVLLVPTIPTTLSIRALGQLVRHLQEEGPRELPVLPFFSLVDLRKLLHREISSARAVEGVSFLEARIPYSSDVEKMGLRRAPLAAYAPESDAARAYDALWREVLGHTGSWLGFLRHDRFGF